MATSRRGVIVIHHPTSGGQTRVPADAFDAYEAKGWKEGPRPKALEDKAQARAAARQEAVRKERDAARKERRETRKATRESATKKEG